MQARHCVRSSASALVGLKHATIACTDRLFKSFPKVTAELLWRERERGGEGEGERKTAHTHIHTYTHALTHKHSLTHARTRTRAAVGFCFRRQTCREYAHEMDASLLGYLPHVDTAKLEQPPAEHQLI